MFNMWKKEEYFKSLIKVLFGFVGILSILLLALMFCWNNSVRNQMFFVPPDISSGVWVKPGDVPASTVYSFASQIFTGVNSWTSSGQDDYLKNIKMFKHYISPGFYNVLSSDYKQRASNGSLDRQRIMANTADDYDPASVKNLGGGTWAVDLKLRIIETVDGQVVKDVIMDYPLKVAQVKTSLAFNQWGLVITGYYADPYRIKTNL